MKESKLGYMLVYPSGYKILGDALLEELKRTLAINIKGENDPILPKIDVEVVHLLSDVQSIVDDTSDSLDKKDFRNIIFFNPESHDNFAIMAQAMVRKYSMDKTVRRYFIYIDGHRYLYRFITQDENFHFIEGIDPRKISEEILSKVDGFIFQDAIDYQERQDRRLGTPAD